MLVGMPSILAEPRRKKQRIGVDPRNLQWRNSSDNFGAKLLGKMGWSEGKGIGKSEQGMSENLRVNANYTSRGFGYDITSDKTWVAHNDEFAQILAGLNKQNKESKKSTAENTERDDESMAKPHQREPKVERIRQRLKRKKYIKNLSDCSEFDKAGIFGKVAVATQADSPTAETNDDGKIEEDPKAEEEAEERPSFCAGAEHTISTLSMSDYFAQKMRQKSAALVKPEAIQRTEEDDANSETKSTDADKEEEERRLRKAARKAEKRRKLLEGEQ